MTRLSPLPLVLLLAACSSGSDDPSGYADILADAKDLHEAVEAAPGYDPALIPTTGTATYEGYVALDLPVLPDSESVVVGELDLDVDFGSDKPFTGKATDFQGAGNERYTGSLDVGPTGFIDRSPADDDPSLVFTMVGELVRPEGPSFAVVSSASGDFHGADRNFAVGSVGGSACASEGGCGDVSGYWVVAD